MREQSSLSLLYNHHTLRIHTLTAKTAPPNMGQLGMCPTPVILPPVSSSLLKIQVYVTGHIFYLFFFLSPQKFLNLSNL